MIGRPVTAGEDPAATALEPAIARLLTVGTYLAIALLTVGVVLLLASGASPRSADGGLDVGRIPADIAALRPAGFIWLGLLVVIATPSARVATALLGYVRRGERDMAIVGTLILVVIATSVTLARIVEG
ncbi:MAG TPA: DUF1634 domain-containing protein [Candidatus Limnocylindrales bacterium]|nr:DUF1634 domain-containing protein [Candidatus Limnocylindrales bacterium]